MTRSFDPTVACWRQDTVLRGVVQLAPHFDEPAQTVHDDYPTLKLYRNIVEDYLWWELTHSEGILHAFIGIYNLLCRDRCDRLPIDITQGIAPSLLPYSLGWYTDSPLPGNKQNRLT